MVGPKWKDLIIQVMKDAEEPLHYAAIAQIVIDGNLRKEVGATPSRTVSSIITQSIKDFGEKSPYVKTEPGVYGLREVSTEVQPIEAHDEAVEDAERMGLINAFGMFWRRELVDWRPAEPELLGQQQHGSDPVNFAAEVGVYILYDGPRIIYVGRVDGQRLSKRLREHITDRLNGRWDRFSWFGVRGVSDNGKLHEARSSFGLENLVATMEALLIEGLEPPQNRRRGDSFNAVEFIQTSVLDADPN